MPISTAHADYYAAEPEWSRARDVLSGEDAVKAGGEKYLPRMDSQTEEDYAAYKARASFFGATARTLAEYLDLVFRRAPVISLGNGEASDPPANSPLRGFVADCDLWGLDFLRYARRIVGEVLAVGRAGSLVLYDPCAARPLVKLFTAEQILNWKTEQGTGAPVLTEVVLRDGDHIRAFRLVDGTCFEELWTVSPSDRLTESPSYRLLSRSQLSTLNSQPVPTIPFVFHGPRNLRPEPDRLPLADIIAANLDHYRLDADLKHGLHFAALPTAWVSGFDKATPLRIGSSAAWVSDIPGASAGFLEFSGAGLGHIERALERVERRMALLGARMLEAPQPEADGQLATFNSPLSTNLSGLGSMVASLNESLTRVLQVAGWWVQGGQVGDTTEVAFAMNTDMGARAISGESLTAVVAAWKAGAISRESMLDVLKRGEVLPEGRTVAQERALIHGKARTDA